MRALGLRVRLRAQNCLGSAEDHAKAVSALEPWGELCDKAQAGAFAGVAGEDGQPKISFSKVTRAAIDARLVEYVACCTTSFRSTEHPAFRALLASVAAGGAGYRRVPSGLTLKQQCALTVDACCRPPERHRLAGTVLDAALAARELQVAAKLSWATQNARGTLAVDGLKAAHKKGVKLQQARGTSPVCSVPSCIEHIPGVPQSVLCLADGTRLLVQSTNLSGTSQTAEVLADDLEKAVEAVGAKHVLVFACDGAAAQRKALRRAPSPLPSPRALTVAHCLGRRASPSLAPACQQVARVPYCASLGPSGCLSHAVPETFSSSSAARRTRTTCCCRPSASSNASSWS